MNKKIVFLRYLPLTKKVVEDFNMLELSRLGYIIEYWDLSLLFWKNVSEVECYIPKKDNSIIVLSFNSKRLLKNAIQNNYSALFISLMSFEWKTLFLFRYLALFNCKSAVFSFWPLPIELYCNSKGSNIINKILNIILHPIKAYHFISHRVKNRVFIHIALKCKIAKAFDVCFVGGENGRKGLGLFSKSELLNTKFYEVNYWDYDKLIKSDIHVEDKHFMVFLDEYYPFHPDARMMSQSKPIDATPYYYELNNVFSELEKYYKMPVVIAAHPKALKYKEKNYFDGRKVLFNSTVELVAHSSIVLAQDSLSICTAIICNKPLLFVNSVRMRSHCPNFYYHILSYSNFFNYPMVLCDDFTTKGLPTDFELSKEKKEFNEMFRKKYLSCVTPPRRNIELLKEYLEEIFVNE